MRTKDNGGPAFPVDRIIERNERGYLQGPEISSAGMTLRDYFAAKAMQADIASVARGHDWIPHADVFAKIAYAMADAMMKARES